MRVHLERLVELEYLSVRHGRLGSQFIYEVLFDLDAPENVAHIGLIDVATLRQTGNAHDYKTYLTGFEGGVADQNGHLAGGGETPPPPVCANADAAFVST